MGVDYPRFADPILRDRATDPDAGRRGVCFGERDLRLLGLLSILFKSAILAVTRKPLRPSFAITSIYLE
jgi:hypothetical protein